MHKILWVILSFVFTTTSFAESALLPWPVSPRDSAHSVGYNFTQYRQYGRSAPAHFHAATDIVTAPDALVRSPIEGVVTAGYYKYRYLPDGRYERYGCAWPCEGDPLDFDVDITRADGTRFELRHVSEGSLTNEALQALRSGEPIAAGTPLGTVHPWGSFGPDGTDFTHIHYRIVAPNGLILNPEALSVPITDTIPPTVDRLLTYFDEGGIAEFDDGVFGDDLREIVVAAFDMREANVYKHGLSQIRLTIGGSVAYEFDFREALTDGEGGFPPIQQVYKDRALTPEGIMVETVGTHQQNYFLYSVPVPRGMSGELELLVADQAGNAQRFTGEIDPRNPRYPDRPDPVLPDPGECREKIAAITCVVNPPEPGSPPGPRACQGGEEPYIAIFEDLFDQYPPVLQRVFCSLNHIYIENRLFGTAYAGARAGPTGQWQGAELGMRRSILDAGLTFDHWATWKEQLSFGADPVDYGIDPDLQQVSSGRPGTANGFLFFLVAHEFAHIIDHTNRINRFENCNPDDGCQVSPGSFAALSWETDLRPLPFEDFPLRSGLCFYDCETPLPVTAAQELYVDLWETTFISPYAATEPDEDWAETFAYYIYDLYAEGAYRIATDQASFDFLERLHSETLQEKRAFVERVVTSPYLRYP